MTSSAAARVTPAHGEVAPADPGDFPVPDQQPTGSGDSPRRAQGQEEGDFSLKFGLWLGFVRTLRPLGHKQKIGTASKVLVHLTKLRIMIFGPTSVPSCSDWDALESHV